MIRVLIFLLVFFLLAFFVLWNVRHLIEKKRLIRFLKIIGIGFVATLFSLLSFSALYAIEHLI